jgi:pilus assembly protein CpaB
MKNRAIIPLVIGLAVGLIAVKLSVDVVQKARASNSSENMSQVVVAQQLIPMGAEIKANMLSVTKTSKSLAPQGASDDPKKLAGRVVRTQIPKGVPVIEEMLAAPGTPAGMASLVPSGYRAVAVKVDEDSSVAGFLKPGCRVDVAAVLSVRPAGGQAETISKVILQDITVGAVGQSLTGEGDSASNLSRSITLLVKPEEVSILHLAASQGKLRLAMRHYDDVGATAGESISRESELDSDAVKKPENKSGQGDFLSGLAKLFRREQAPRAEAPKPAWVAQVAQRSEPIEVKPPYVVTVLNGGAVESLTFENSRSVHRVAPGAGHTSGALATAGDAVPGNRPGKIAEAQEVNNAPAESAEASPPFRRTE